MIHFCSGLVKVTLNTVGVNDYTDNIKWLTLDEALKSSKELKLPILVFIHLPLCESCNRLRPIIESSEEIITLSKDFLMVQINEQNVKDDFRIDGQYTPRIIFLSPDGKPLPQFINKLGNPNIKYYYPNAKSIVKAMSEVSLAYPVKCPTDKPCHLHGVQNSNWKRSADKQH
ncbi:thioredoxin domain-containing protein 12-like [Cimex lectularius]|uniref:Thioredoxin domain-containing protein n=1 Tax=Cimex lectularius TaxID=79782 RepID=A0A8I6RMP5_CIMLE|nr:thioredoxin domain-containing protein 12-like [Cimex lectularius]